MRKNFSLMTSLLSVINENDVGDGNYKLANYLLENFDRLDELVIYDIADECFVSRSSVRRFCLSIGVDNFSNIKQNYGEWDHQYGKYKLAAQNILTKDFQRTRIDCVLNKIEEVATKEFLEFITKQIHDKKNIVFVASEFSASSIKEFQQSMVTAGKIIKIMSSAYANEELIDSLTENDLIITISVTGRYAEQIHKHIRKAKCKKMLITSEPNADVCIEYEKIIDLKQKVDVEIARDFSKYGISYLLDLIFAYYYDAYVLK